MKNPRQRLCSECKHCLWIAVIDEAVPFCNNTLTKQREHPIGFLSRQAPACELFEEIQRDREPTRDRTRPKALPIRARNGTLMIDI
jgi:hypothetical protein